MTDTIIHFSYQQHYYNIVLRYIYVYLYIVHFITGNGSKDIHQNIEGIKQLCYCIL